MDTKKGKKGKGNVVMDMEEDQPGPSSTSSGNSRNRESVSHSDDKDDEKSREDRQLIFHCEDCGLHEACDYYGKNPPFSRGVILHEDTFVLQNPFPPYGDRCVNYMILGGPCSLCTRLSCHGCSTFFGRRFCARCIAENSDKLPEQLFRKKNAKTTTSTKQGG